MMIVTAANISDQRGAKILFWEARRQGVSLGQLVRIWADVGYQGEAFMEWVMDHFWSWKGSSAQIHQPDLRLFPNDGLSSGRFRYRGLGSSKKILRSLLEHLKRLCM